MQRLWLAAAFAALAGITLWPGLDPFAGSSYRVVHGWPQAPEGSPFAGVAGVDVDSRHRVFIFQRTDPPILCFDGATGKLLASWGEGRFTESAHGLEVDPRDNVWVVDVEHHQVFKFSPRGELLMTLGTRGTPGLGPAHFNKPTDVAVADSGEIFVADGYNNSRVAKFSSEGKFLLDWGSKGDQLGQLDTPHGIAVDGRGRVYLADRGNRRIQVFDGAGRLLDHWTSPRMRRPWGLDIGADGSVFVADGGDLVHRGKKERILKFSPEGRLLDLWGSFGRYDGQFYWAHDVAVAPTGEVYVCDVLGRRVQKFVAGPSG